MANIFETARARHAYNKYIRGLESVEGLVEALSGPGPYTIFIPTDAAFERLSGDQQADLFADPGKLAKVVKEELDDMSYGAVSGGGVTIAEIVSRRGLPDDREVEFLTLDDLIAR